MRIFPYWLGLSLVIGVLSSNTSVARLEDVDQQIKRANKNYIDRFKVFTQDRNYMGKAVYPDGKLADSPHKSRYDADDENPYQSILTYHDTSWDKIEVVEEQPQNQAQNQGANPSANNQNKPKETIRKKFAFTADHHGQDASELENSIYESHEKYNKPEEKKKSRNAAKREEGVVYKSIFKVTTSNIYSVDDEERGPDEKPQNNNQANNQGQGNNQDDDKPKETDRWELRDEVKKIAEEIGERSSESLAREARDADKKNDSKASPNGVLLRMGAWEAAKAWWRNVLANLGQRRANRAVKKSGDRVKMAEHAENCDAWKQEALAELNQEAQKTKMSDTERQEREKEIQKMVGKCEEVSDLPYTSVMPRYKADKQGDEKLEELGREEEDARERDMRVQLSVLEKGGVDPNAVGANWKYEQKDSASKVTLTFDESAEPTGQVELPVSDQLELYNQELQAAQQDYEAIKDRVPDIEVPDVLQYQIAPGQKSVMKILELPDHVKEEFGNFKNDEDAPATIYNDLVQK